MLPVQVAIVLNLFVMALWWYLDTQRNIELQNLIYDKAVEQSSYIKADFRARLPALNRIAQRWEVHGGTSKRAFLADAKAYVRDLPGFQAIEWVDRNFYVRWIAPLQGNEMAQGLNLAFEEKRRIALEAARDSSKPTMTSAIELIQGGKGFLVYIPLTSNNSFDGFVLSVFKIEQWLNYVFSLRALAETKENFRIAVQLDDERVYMQQGWHEGEHTDWQATSNITILDQVISVSVLPTEHFFATKMTYVPESVAAIGVLLSVLLALMVFLVQKTNTSIARVRNINIALEENIQERKRAESDAKSASQAKSQFLSSMSHELRTPLNAILGFSQLLEMYSKDELTKKHLHEIVNAGNHLLELISEILDLSQIESGKLKLSIENHSLNTLVNSCLSIINPVADKHSIQIVDNVSEIADISINVDEKRFKQALINILSNAIKYNSENGRVVVDRCPAEEGMHCLSITDTGRGMTAEQQHHLFRAFERHGADRTKIEGTGLGLAISKDLIDLMGGTIDVESEVGKGSQFRIHLPAS